MYAYVYIYVYVCLFVCVRARGREHGHALANIYLYSLLCIRMYKIRRRSLPSSRSFVRSRFGHVIASAQLEKTRKEITDQSMMI